MTDTNKTVFELIVKQAKSFKSAALFVKLMLIVFPSAIVAIAQFAQVPTGTPFTFWQAAGIISAMVVAIGGVFVIITEHDAPEALAAAHEASERAREIEAEFGGLADYMLEYGRLVELYSALGVMRGVVERVAINHAISEEALVATLLQACERSLTIALDFKQSNQWTICIYKAFDEKGDGRMVLRLVAHKRAIDCDIKLARNWPEGTGIAGVSFSNATEIIVPDLNADGIKAIFASPVVPNRQYDNDRYRSMVAVPVEIGRGRPWGVVTATNDTIGHFAPDGEPGLKTDEGVRALAGMVALAVAVHRLKHPTITPSVGTVVPGSHASVSAQLPAASGATKPRQRRSSPEASSAGPATAPTSARTRRTAKTAE